VMLWRAGVGTGMVWTLALNAFNPD